MAYNGIKGNVVVEDLFIPKYYEIDLPSFKYEKDWIDESEKTHGYWKIIK